MEGLGIGKKRLQHNVVDLFPEAQLVRTDANRIRISFKTQKIYDLGTN